MIDFYSTNNLKITGAIDKKFKLWLDCNFGHYTQGLLVDYFWDSTVVYQYDSEEDKIKSTYDEISFNNLDNWRIYDDNGDLIIVFYHGEMMWNAYVMAWLSYNKPDYVILPGV